MFEVLSGCNVIGHGIFGSMASNYEPPQPPNYDNIEMEGMGTLTLPNSLKAPIDRLQLLGNSTQGCTIKVLSTELEHGTINAGNGENFPSNYRVRTKGFSDIQKGKYKVTCEGAKQANIIFYSTDGIYKNTLFKAHTVFPFYFTANEACKIRVAVSNGTEEEAIAIKPENVKSITVATEATPEYPQEIKSVGRKSRNLFDISKFPLEHDEEAIIIKPTDVTAKLIDGNELEENTRYTVWFESYENTQTENTDAPLIEIVYTDGTKSEIYVHRNFYIKTDASKNVSYIWFRNPWKSGCKLSRLQIEKGNSITQYEPYGMYLLDVQVSGRNLIDIDALRNENGYISGNYDNSRDIDHFNIVKGKRYLLITKGKPLVSDYSSVYFGDETLKYGTNIGDWLATATGYVSFTSDLEQNRAILTAKKTATITKMILHGKANTRKDDYDVEEFGLFEIIEDNTNIDYEPYKEPQTTQIALDEPLRGIGQYKDVITKDRIVRNILQVRIADYLQNTIYGESGKKYIFSEAPNCYINYDRNRCISNVGFTTNKEDITYVPVPYLDKFKLGVQDEDTVETIREKVKDVIVAYTVKEPITEPLQTELGNVHTYNGTTIVSVDSGEVETGIKLTYRKEK